MEQPRSVGKQISSVTRPFLVPVAPGGYWDGARVTNPQKQFHGNNYFIKINNVMTNENYLLINRHARSADILYFVCLIISTIKLIPCTK